MHKPHHSDKVADHGGDFPSFCPKIVVIVVATNSTRGEQGSQDVHDLLKLVGLHIRCRRHHALLVGLVKQSWAGIKAARSEILTSFSLQEVELSLAGAKVRGNESSIIPPRAMPLQCIHWTSLSSQFDILHHVNEMLWDSGLTCLLFISQNISQLIKHQDRLVVNSQ